MSALSIAERIGQLLLPFAEKEYIDVPRCCRILGTDEWVVRRMADSGLIDMIDYLPRTRKKIRYQSVVDFCDRLRSQYGIADRRAPLVPPYRHRDSELLPFPLADTIDSAQSMRAIGCAPYTLRRLIEEGCIPAYRFAESSGTPWRISRAGVAEYMRRTLRGVASGPRAYAHNNIDE